MLYQTATNITVGYCSSQPLLIGHHENNLQAGVIERAHGIPDSGTSGEEGFAPIADAHLCRPLTENRAVAALNGKIVKPLLRQAAQRVVSQFIEDLRAGPAVAIGIDHVFQSSTELGR